jgi:transglutaminase-like putative cysteine protease
MKINSLKLVRHSLALVLLFTALLARAESDRYTGSKWDLVDTKAVLQAAAEITLTNYPDCDEATVEQRSVRVYRPDGTGEAQDETFTKALTEKGKRNNRVLTLDFMLPYYTVEVVKLEVLKPNGEVVPVDVAANSKEAIDDSQMSMNIYDPNNKVLKVTIPKVEIGDVVHSVTRTTTQRSIIPGEFADRNIFEGRGYIRHVTYEVHAPAGKPLQRIVLRDEIPGTIKYTSESEADGGTFHRWEVNKVPRMFDEPNMPSYEEVLQRLIVSTTPDWPAVSKWYWDLSKPHLDATVPDMKKKVDELIAGTTNDLDKAKAIFYYVSKEIRYMGLTPEKDRPGYEPHDVKLTFEKKWGVCRDKAGLLVSLLRTAGLNAFPVLVSVGTKKDKDVAEPFFNHAIVSVELKKGDYVLMDPTDENTRELLPSYECNQSYLVCRPEGEQIRVSPIIPPEENMMRVKTTGVLTAAGSLEAKSELWFDGINDNSYRSAFAQMKPDEQRRFFERNLKRSMPGARVKSLKLFPENMLDVTATLRAELEFSVEGLTAPGNNKAVVSLPWLGEELGIINFILGGTGLEKRKYPLQTYVACGLKEDLDIKLADGFTGAVSMPTCSPVNDPWLSYQERCAFTTGKLDCSRELKLKVVEFSPQQYRKLKQTLEIMENDQRKAPVLTIAEGVNNAARKREAVDPPAVDSNARVLESQKEVVVKDAHTASLHVKYSKRILTYEGKKREAEIKLDYNPSCQEAKFIRGVVISKSGQSQEISTNEINVMDAGWNASAKRYTGGKVLVANLPSVEIGSTIEVEFSISSKDRPFLSGFEYFQLPDELDQKTFRLIAPSDLKVQKVTSGPAGIIKEQNHSADGKQVWEWSTEKVKALPAEGQLPPEWAYASGVNYLVGDEKAYFQDLYKVLMDRSSKRAKVEEQTRQLTAQATNKLEAVRAIRDFVAKSIRHAGPSFTDLPLSELSAADTTLAEGYGHGADRAILLHAMLSAAGFKPEFVMASGLPPISGITKVTSSFPLPGSFQVPLVRVKVDGESYYLNDTDQYAHLGSMTLDNRLAITLPGAKPQVIHAAKDCQDKTDTVYTLSVENDGKTRIGIARHYYGSDYNRKNRYFSELPPEERRRYFQEIVSGVAQGARPIGDLTTKFDAYPGIEEFTVEIDHYSVVDGKYLYFDLPFTPSLFPMGADQRVLPLYLSRDLSDSIRTEIQLPASYRHVVISPVSREFVAPGKSGKVRVKSSKSGDKYVFTHDFISAPAILDPKQYPAMLDFQSDLGRKSSRVLLLEKE